VWISLRAEADVLAEAERLDARVAAGAGPRLPLAGLVAAVKDNIDVAGLPTTAGSAAFAYSPEADAVAVARIRAAGAIVLGKTNLDQFATGLVGTRSPYGAVRNAWDPARISGGSSSGSAVAVALGVVDIALGTDTAGSGRVPAALNGVVGVKPTRALVPTTGVVPACRSLDCVTVFARDLALARLAAGIMAGDDERDRAVLPAVPRVAIPNPEHLRGLAEGWAEAFADTVERLRDTGVEIVEADITPLLEAADLLYGGAFVAERHAAVGAFIEKAEDSAGIWPTTRDIILGGRKYSAVDAFEGQYKLKELLAKAQQAMRDLDFLALPTAGTIYTLADLEREPVRYNSNLGHYTNFVNFFGLSALALPFGFRPDGLPFGITLVGHPGADAALLDFGAEWQRADPLPLGRTLHTLPPALPRVSIAVVGAHMDGLPLNEQLVTRGGKLEFAGTTAPHYRLYALPGGPPHRPGLVRVADGGAAIDLEVWSLPPGTYGNFVETIPAPLGIGTIELADGSTVQGFLCESYATAGARDITNFGGWRAYLKSLG